jgi:hypothetical protein
MHEIVILLVDFKAANFVPNFWGKGKIEGSGKHSVEVLEKEFNIKSKLKKIT